LGEETVVLNVNWDPPITWSLLRFPNLAVEAFSRLWTAQMLAPVSPYRFSPACAD